MHVWVYHQDCLTHLLFIICQIVLYGENANYKVLREPVPGGVGGGSGPDKGGTVLGGFYLLMMQTLGTLASLCL